MAEVELKLAVPSAALEPLRRRLQRLGQARIERLDSTYFDTPERLLAQGRVALRVRRQAKGWVQTLKTGDAHAALSTRGEWEVPAPRGRLDVRRFPRVATDALAALGLDPDRVGALRPWFRTTFQRSAWQVTRGAAAIEVALDEGEIAGGDGRLPVQELELELLRGDEGELLALALELVAPPRAAVLPLLPLGESKAARGARLADGTALAPTKANAKRIGAGLKPSDPAAVALRKVLRSGLDVLLANCHGLLVADEPEFVHQARVALRRMRSAQRLLARDADMPQALVEDLRWIARTLGPARDADVLLLETLPPWLAQLPADLKEPAEALVQAAQAMQAQERSQARAMLGAPRFALFALRLLRWTASMPEETSSRSLRQLAPRRLRKAQGRLIKAGRFFTALAPAERHRVRILAKRLRYAVDLFSCALGPRAARICGEALAGLQDQLGALNDAAVALATLPRLTGVPELLQAAQAWFEGTQLDRLRRLVDAEAALAGLTQLPAPWGGRKR